MPSASDPAVMSGVLHPVDLGFLSVFLAALFTCLVCFVEVPRESKANLRNCIGILFFIYLFLRLAGNSLATFLASAILAEKLTTTWIWNAFLDAFAGVFAFEGILKNTNATFFGKGFLTIEDWITGAKQNAVAFAVKKETEHKGRLQQSLADAFDKSALTEAQLNAFITEVLVETAVRDLEGKAEMANADARLYKSLTLARNPRAEQIARAKGLPGFTDRRWWR